MREAVQEEIKEKSKEKLQDTVDGGKSEIKALKKQFVCDIIRPQ